MLGDSGVLAATAADAEAHYGALLAEHGPSPEGAGWNSAAAQEIRFRELLRICEGAAERPLSLIDYGCGFGALAGWLREREESFDYTGFDLWADAITEAERAHAGPGASFTTREEELEPAAFTVASGIFNLRFDVPDEDWREHVLATIDRLAALSVRGFAFNMLTSHSDRERMRPELYYGDPAFFLDHCLRRFGRRAALLHDYELFDFTVLVRLDER